MKTPRSVRCPQCKKLTQEPSEDTGWRCGVYVGQGPQRRMCMFDFFENMTARGMTEEDYIESILVKPTPALMVPDGTSPPPTGVTFKDPSPPPAGITFAAPVQTGTFKDASGTPRRVVAGVLCTCDVPDHAANCPARPSGIDAFVCRHERGPALIAHEGFSVSICPKCKAQVEWRETSMKKEDFVAAFPQALTFAALRHANVHRLPEFRDAKGRICHLPDGSDWALSAWSNACLGELGEAANLIKKVERGDLTLDEARAALGRELADVQTYLDLLAFRAGVDLGEATRAKFNEVSVRVQSQVRL